MDMEKVGEKNMVRVQQKEIDLMDLFKMLYKNRIMIVVVTVAVTLASLGGAFYNRLNTENITAIDFKFRNGLADFYLKKAKLHLKTFDEDKVLKNDKIVEELMEIPSLKESFEASGQPETLENKREFLEGIIDLKRVEENKNGQGVFKNFQIKMEQSNAIDEKSVIKEYLEILNREKKLIYKEAVDEKYDEVKEKTRLYGEELAKLDEEIRRIIDQEPEAILRNEGIVGILSVKYPKTMRDQNSARELYSKYNEELIGLEGLRENKEMEKQVEVLSSFYEIKQKSKAKLILAVGVVMGVILGMMMAFMKEFWKHFKEEIN